MPFVSYSHSHCYCPLSKSSSMLERYSELCPFFIHPELMKTSNSEFCIMMCCETDNGILVNCIELVLLESRVLLYELLQHELVVIMRQVFNED